MKYLISIIIISIFIIILFTTEYTQTEIETMKISTNEIDNISIDVEKLEVNIAATEQDYITVEHIFNQKNQKNIKLYSNIDDKTLYISDYIEREKKIISPKEILNIYIPKNFRLDNLHINLKSGKIKVNNININDLIITTNQASINLNNLNAKNISISNNIGSNKLTNLKTETLAVGGNEMYLEITNLIAKKNVINAEGSSEIHLTNTISDILNIYAPKGNLFLEVQSNLNYEIYTSEIIESKYFEYNNNSYRYIGDEKLKSSEIININQIDEVNIIMNSKETNEK